MNLPFDLALSEMHYTDRDGDEMAEHPAGVEWYGLQAIGAANRVKAEI